MGEEQKKTGQYGTCSVMFLRRNISGEPWYEIG